MKELNLYQRYIHLSRYARYNPLEGRRETFEESVERYIGFLAKTFPAGSTVDAALKVAKRAILNLDVMPSMRALMTAGPALDRDHMAAFNCSYLPIDCPRSFDEVLYILMCGTGVGFSVESSQVSKLPVVPELHPSDTTIVAADSKVGWAVALRQLISLLYAGHVPKWDFSKIRPAGSVLKTFGGRASGPEPLDRLFRFTIEMFERARGRNLLPIEVHDIICYIGECVVAGGVRRSALISLSDIDDRSMRLAKSGTWWDSPSEGIVRNGQRALANNSAVYERKPSVARFLSEWGALIESGSGERGIFNREAARKKVQESGLGRDHDYVWGTNPCGEILLRPQGLCNLTEVVVRPEDTLLALAKKVEAATILGTLQSMLTEFRYVRKVWQTNAEEERLLGVSLTGIMDHPTLSEISEVSMTWLRDLRAGARKVNCMVVDWLRQAGYDIMPSVAITTVKPSGTVSQLVDSASGIHSRYAPYYLRTVRAGVEDPLTKLMMDQGVPWEPDHTRPHAMVVFTFPMEAPEGAVTRNSRTAIQQLEHAAMVRDEWCDHNVSQTVSVRDDEWLDVGAWVYKNFNNVGGVSFLPYVDYVYRQAPYTEIDKEQYEAAVAAMPEDIDWSKLGEYESGDYTTGSQEFACTAGSCDVV